MNNLPPQSLPLTEVSGGLAKNLLGNFIGTYIVILVVFVIIILALYLYTSVVYSKIGAKAGLNSPGIAWMPLGGVLAVIFESSKMHWWPFLMWVVGLVVGNLLMLLSPAVGFAKILTILTSIVLSAIMIVFVVMVIIWHWKTYEAIGKPGWWILVPVISVILGYALILGGVAAKIFVMLFFGIIIGAIGIIAHLVLIGIAAFSESTDEALENRFYTDTLPSSQSSGDVTEI